MFIDQATIRIKAGDGVASSATSEVEAIHVVLWPEDFESLCYRRSLASLGMD